MDAMRKLQRVVVTSEPVPIFVAQYSMVVSFSVASTRWDGQPNGACLISDDVRDFTDWKGNVSHGYPMMFDTLHRVHLLPGDRVFAVSNDESHIGIAIETVYGG